LKSNSRHVVLEKKGKEGGGKKLGHLSLGRTGGAVACTLRARKKGEKSSPPPVWMYVRRKKNTLFILAPVKEKKRKKGKSACRVFPCLREVTKGKRKKRVGKERLNHPLVG